MGESRDAARLASAFEQLTAQVAREAPKLTPVVRRIGEEITANRERLVVLEERLEQLAAR